MPTVASRGKTTDGMENEEREDVIVLSELNVRLLERAIEHGMDGAYYDPGPVPIVDKSTGLFIREGDRTMISRAQLEALAEYYGEPVETVIGAMSDEKKCDYWCRASAVPSDDPW